MHSSRMCIARSLIASHSIHRVCVCLWDTYGGGMHGRRVYMVGACMEGGHEWQGVCMVGECMAGGVFGGGMYGGGMHGRAGACMAHMSLPVDRMTDTCKNITLLQTSFADGNKYIIWRGEEVHFGDSSSRFTCKHFCHLSKFLFLLSHPHKVFATHPYFFLWHQSFLRYQSF